MANLGLVPRSALAGLADIGRGEVPSGPVGVFVSERTNLTLASVAALRNSTGALARRMHEVFGFEPPLEPRHIGGDEVAFAWTGLAQWLAIGTGVQGDALVTRLRAELSGLASISDQTDGRVVIRLRGPDVRSLLAKGLPIDLHPRAFAPGHAAVTVLGQVGLHIWQVDAQPTYDLVVPTSYAAYVWRWIVDAAAQFGLSVDSDGTEAPARAGC
jgi:heterotetrameric sarcosine oxidase gamma subunit